MPILVGISKPGLSDYSGIFSASSEADPDPLYPQKRTPLSATSFATLYYSRRLDAGHSPTRKTDPHGQLYIRLPTASTRTCASHKSKIGGDQLVRPFATAPIDLGGNCINQVAV